MSLANKLSLFRILLVPAFVVCLLYYRAGESEWLRYLAAALFVVGVITDAVDGYVARAEGQASRLGAILDPAADKLFLVTAFLSLSLISSLPASLRLPPWVPILVISRDLLIVCGWLLIVLVTGDLKAIPSRLGKATTFFQMLTVLAVLLGWPAAGPILWIAMGLTVLSGIGYIRYGNQVLNFAGPQGANHRPGRAPDKQEPSRPSVGAGV
ncbi:MAG: CDP-alcohol phosphatidyltransferase family protein [Candidatus Omnitrophica bacterium]|nr:CDP-alcohol phosphatidyltransferase family protein [Candidatus Omnitrophota bacterium]